MYDQVIDMYRKGIRVVEISSRLKLTNNEVSGAIQKHYGTDRAKQSSRYTDPVLQGWIKYDFDNGLSSRDIAKKYRLNLAHMQIGRTYIRQEETDNTVKEKADKNVRREQEILRLLLEGRTLKDVGIELSLSHERIRQIMVEFIGEHNYQKLFSTRSTIKMVNRIETTRTLLEANTPPKKMSKILQTSEQKVKALIRIIFSQEEYQEYYRLHKSPRPKKKHPYIIKLLLQGLSYSKIALTAGCSIALVNKVAQLELTIEQKDGINKQKDNIGPYARGKLGIIS